MPKQRRRAMTSHDEAENFWPSFADLTSTIALIFFVLVLLSFVQNLIAGKQLDSVKKELQLSLRNLNNARLEIESSEKRLKTLSAQIDLGQAELRVSGDKLAAQQDIITNSARELDTLRTRLQGIAVLRLDLLQKVKQSIETELARSGGAPSSPVIIADNGNIVINESLVFESDAYTIKPNARALLNTLASAFANVLADEEVRQVIDVILVQGHTDSRGTVTYNRELSAKRANAVLDYMFNASPALEQSYGSYFASSAYSEFRPLKGEQSEGAYAQNRRIEISVVLRDASVRKLIDEYMRGANPSLAPAEPVPAP